MRLWRSKRFAEAAQQFRSAALNGHAKGAYALGVMLLNGPLGKSSMNGEGNLWNRDILDEFGERIGCECESVLFKFVRFESDFFFKDEIIDN